MDNTLESNLEADDDFKALMTSSLDGQKATLANELPPELLVQIFEMAQNMFSPLEQHLSWRFPFVLGKVSRYWRQVAYGTPTLWSNVDSRFAEIWTVYRSILADPRTPLSILISPLPLP